MWRKSLVDAERSLEAGQPSARSYYRKGVALRELGLLDASLAALELGLGLDPSSKQLKRAASGARTMVRRQFQASRQPQVVAAKVAFEAKVGGRLEAEALRAEEAARRDRERREDYRRHELRSEETQR